MSKVYLVSSGEYSGYGVDHVFSTEEKAKEFMAAVPGGWNDYIEEKDLDLPTAQKVKQGLEFWEIELLRNGDLKMSRKHDVDDRYYEEAYFVRGPNLWYRSEIPHLVVRCFARDKEHAIKIAGEKRTQSILQGMWEEKKPEPPKPIGQVKDIERLPDGGLKFTVQLEDKETSE